MNLATKKKWVVSSQWRNFSFWNLTAVRSFRLEMDLQAKPSPVSRSVQRYVIPNSPRPSSRPSIYLSLIRVRWLSGITSFRTRIGAGSSENRLELLWRVFWFLSLFWSSTSALTHALQFPILGKALGPKSDSLYRCLRYLRQRYTLSECCRWNWSRGCWPQSMVAPIGPPRQKKRENAGVSHTVGKRSAFWKINPLCWSVSVHLFFLSLNLL